LSPNGLQQQISKSLVFSKASLELGFGMLIEIGVLHFLFSKFYRVL